MMTTRTQKHLLNTLLIVAFFAVCSLFLIGLYKVWYAGETKIDLLSTRIGISIILIWFMIFLPYLAWAVYFYNINSGKTNEEWEAISRRNQEREKGEEEVIPVNPYKDETFGLPKGTIRGSIAITLMVGALSMFVVAIGHPYILRTNEFFHENFEFFKTAFLMMIAFYFGGKSLEYLRERWTIDTGSPANPRSGTGSTGAPRRDPEIEESEEKEVFPKMSAYKLNGSNGTEKVNGTPTSLNGHLKADSKENGLSEIQPLMTEVHLIPTEQKEATKELAQDEIEDHAKTLGVDLAALKAVIAVESSGKGFLEDGRPKILFEGHIFWRQLDKIKDTTKINPADMAVNHPEIVYPRWTKKFYKGGAAEYQRYGTACMIHDEAAKKSASWGMFQIMGFNHKACGFDTVDAFVNAMSLNEHEQLKAFTKFCEHEKLLDSLRKKDWVTFAKKYNGPEYAQNQYDYKLEMKYHFFSREFNPKISVKIERQTASDKQTLGELRVMEEGLEIFKCKTLELPDLNNKRNVSCIPKTVDEKTNTNNPYTVVKRWSEERNNHFHVLNVPNRSAILIHSGNYYTHTLGCILVGKDITDMNKDGYADITNSKLTLATLNDILPNTFTLTISSSVVEKKTATKPDAVSIKEFVEHQPVSS
jgi:hypothetical protein